MSRKHSRNTITDLIAFITFVAAVAVGIKKLMELMKEYEGGSKDQGLVSDVINLVKEQTAKPVTTPKTKAITAKAKPAAKPIAPVRPVAPKLPALNLNKRQEKIFLMLRQKGSVTMQAIAKEFPSVSSRTLRRDMTQLEELNLVSQSGRTRNSVYKLLPI